MAEKDGFLSVSGALALAKGAVGTLGNLAVLGEVSGFRGPNARSGHCYFSVKDESGSMDVVVWKGVYQALGFELKDGAQLQLRGAFDVYAGTGRLSFIARHVELAGEGLLRQQIAELARRLAAEGLMADERKPQVPPFCQRVCVVTSLSGSVIEDVKRTLARRNPLVAIDVVGCAVQGPEAPASIVAGLRAAEATRPDAILLVRGGGSLEDLMAFNDEAVARAVAASKVPVVTGIGHEPDTSIADLVASRRASTPTAAAESVAPSFSELEALTLARQRRLADALEDRLFRQGTAQDGLEGRLSAAMERVLAAARAKVQVLDAAAVLKDPTRFVTGRREALDLTAERMDLAMASLMGRAHLRTEPLGPRLDAAVAHRLDAARARTEASAGALASAGPRLLAHKEQTLARLAASLDALSPLRVLGRGYAIATDDQGHVVDTVRDAHCGEGLRVRVQDGVILAQVTGAEPSGGQGR